MSEPLVPPSYVLAPEVAFLSSLAVDRPLARYDLAGSVAHVRMLRHVGLLSSEEAKTLEGGLRVIAGEIAAGGFPWRIELEDVHTNVEVRLHELVGPAGGKLHTGRSRNDQIALDERLYLRAEVREIATLVLCLEETILARARDVANTPMPGYTHLQRAQPVTAGHWLLAHFWKFDRDLDRLLATAERANVSPLGAGALATSTLPVDPAFVAELLGFDRAFENSLDAVSDRDYFAELLFDLALLAVHLSGLAEEIVIFASREFGFVERTPALGSGSSLMPQKRNPDVAELARGKAGGVVGDLVALLVTLKALPLAYDRDLQEDRAPVLDAVRAVSATLAAFGRLVAQLKFAEEPLAAASADPELFATDRAEELVAQGAAFRTAHEAVGAEYRGRAVHDAGPRGIDPRSSLERRSVPGGPSPPAIAAQLVVAESRRSARQLSLSSLDRQAERIEELLSEEPR